MFSPNGSNKPQTDAKQSFAKRALGQAVAPEHTAVSGSAILLSEHRHAGCHAVEAQTLRELQLLHMVDLPAGEMADRRLYEYLYIHASALAQFAREAMEQTR